ncbi:unnamed protein product, partial [Amoebophrya sp. A120]
QQQLPPVVSSATTSSFFENKIYVSKNPCVLCQMRFVASNWAAKHAGWGATGRRVTTGGSTSSDVVLGGYKIKIASPLYGVHDFAQGSTSVDSCATKDGDFFEMTKQ